MPGESVCAVVVTRDRREMLRECLAAVDGQTRAPDAILVVDNASSDGTGGMLAEEFPQVEVKRLDQNTGGAGGFHEGIRAGHERGFDWLWLMDDDTVPEPTALDALLRGADTAASLGGPVSIVASKVVWRDGRLHPMNVPPLGSHRMDVLVEAAGHGLLAIRAASFVSVLLRGDAVERFGLPIKRYFIWSDDIEYTGRILRTDFGYLVPESVVHHKTAAAYVTSEGDPARFYYFARNSLYMVRSRAWDTQEKLRILWWLLWHIRRYLIVNRWRPRAAMIVARGLVHGITTRADDGGPERAPL